MIGDLTTLAKVKVYMKIAAADPSADAALGPLVSSQSRAFAKKTRRDLLYKRYVEVRDGEGAPGIEPRQYPIQRVESVVVDGVTVQQQPAIVAGQAPDYGWVVSNNRVEIRTLFSTGQPFVPDYFPGYASSQPARFTVGSGNVVLTYWAGYLADPEPATIPASPFQVQAQDNFHADVGVTLADGVTVLTKVTASPVTGQYAVSSSGLYTFAAADTGKGVILTYGIVPADVEQAVHEMIEFAYKRRDHAGERSKSLGGGEAVYYDTGALPDSVAAVIEDYERKF